MMNQFILMLHLVFAISKASSADTTTLPVVGRQCPDFHFDDVRYYTQKRVSLNDFKGRWLVLDLWNRHCSSCIDKMPKTDSLQKKFTRKMRFLLVGYTGSRYVRRPENKEMHQLYPKLRKRLNINLPIAYDSVLFHRFEIGPCPYLVIVDPSGIVRGITTELNEQNIKDLLAGKQPVLEKATNRKGN
jgi:thiol-disulfide isomerase/thioredoxin